MTIQSGNELLAAIVELRRKYPEWRLGQLLANVAGWADKDIWDVADEDLLDAARLNLQQSASPNAKVSPAINE